MSAVRVRTTPFTCGRHASLMRAMFKGRRQSRVRARGGERVERPQRCPVQDLEPAVEMLDESGAALDPVAVVAIEDAADVAHLGLVDVAADDAVDAALARLFDDHVGVVADELDRVLDAALEI